MSIKFNGGAWLLLGFALLFISPLKELDAISSVVVSAGIFCLIVAGIRGVRRLKADRNDKVAENNATVIKKVYYQLLEEGGKKSEETFARLCYLVLQDREHADAALKFAKQQSLAQNEVLSFKRIAYSILVGQMYVQKGSEPSQDEKLIAFTAVKNVIGWESEKDPPMPGGYGAMSSGQHTKTGLGGWLTVFIINVVTWTLLCTIGCFSVLVIFATGDLNPDADALSVIMFILLMIPPLVISCLGIWLLILIIKQRKLAIKIGKVFSAITFGIIWIFYLNDSKRVKNTLVR